MDEDKSLELLTVPRAAKLLGIDRAVVRRAIRRGELRAVKLSDSERPWPRMTREALREWVKERES